LHRQISGIWNPKIRFSPIDSQGAVIENTLSPFDGDFVFIQASESFLVSEGKRLNEILEEAIQDLLDRRIREAERTMEKTEKGDLSLAELELLKQQRKLKSQRMDAELKKKSGPPSKKTKKPKK
jgi:hypothetical protein